MKLIDFLKLNKEDLKGKIICFPTDTVYGVGCLYNDYDATLKIYQMKGRDFNKPLAVLISKYDDIYYFTDQLDNKTKELVDKYWPGALTVIVDKKKDCDVVNLIEFSTIGLRMPNSKVSLSILAKFGPLATTSVNLSGNEPLNDLDLIKKTFGKQIDYYIDDLVNFSSVSSTVVKSTKNGIEILREGNIKVN